MNQVGLLLSGAGDPAYRQVFLTAPTCTVDLGGEGGPPLRLDLCDLAAAYRSDPRAPSVSASYRVLDRGGRTRCELALTRDRRAEAVATTVALRTMEGVPLPARVLDAFFDSGEWLGGAAKMQGALTLRQSGSGDWQAEFAGELLDVDLKTLFERRFPRHRMTGLGRVAIKSARWSNRPGQGFGWASAEGELATGPGSVGLELLRALCGEMKFRTARRVDERQPNVPFNALGLTFGLTPDGEIRVGGAFGGQFAPDDIMMAVDDRPLFKAPSGSANVRGLVKTLFPATAESLGPVTADAQLLSRYLPLPPEVARSGRQLRGN